VTNSTPATFADVAIAITFRASDEHRRENLLRVLRHYRDLTDIEIILVEQDSSPCNLGNLSSPTQRVFVQNPGPFNKSWGLNVAARQSSRAILVLMDADLLLEPAALTQAVKLTRTRAFATNPFDSLQDLTLAETQSIRQRPVMDFSGASGSSQRRENEQLNFCGGAFVIQREFYLQLGGFDERFLGWGGEDDHMALKLQRSGKPIGKVQNSTAVHLWHPQTRATTFEQPHYACNLSIVQELAAFDSVQFKFLCELQRQLAGHPHKYQLATHDPLAGYCEPPST
jgi:predicted glycosyltransferase involved in capsule biosynthesis